MMDEKLPLIIENWSLLYKPSEVDDNGPALSDCYIEGQIWNHPKIEDGATIKTDKIKNIVDNRVTTEDGSVFYLMEPEKEYGNFLKEHDGPTIVNLDTIRKSGLN